MAEKTVISIEVDGVQKSINSVKELKDSISDLQKIAENADIGSERQKQAVKQVDELNSQLKQLTQTEEQYAKSLEDVSKAEKEAIKETNDLRKQFEKLEDELFLMAGQGKQNTKEFRNLTIEAAALNKKIDAVNSSLGENSAGRASAGFSQLSDGLKNLDFDSVKKGFAVIKTALAATGVMLLVQGVMYLVENFDSLSKGSGVLAKILRGVGDAISYVKNFVTDLVGITDESSRSLEKQGEAMVKANEKSQEALQARTANFDRQLAVAKAAGKSTIEIEKLKQQAIIDTNVEIAKGIEAHVRKNGEFTEDMKKQLSGSLEAIKNAKVKEYEITETDNKAKQEQYKKHLEEQNKIRQDNEKLISENTIAGAQIDKENRKLIADDISLEEAEKLKLAKEKDDAEYEALLLRIEQKKQTAADEIEIEKTKEAQKLQIQMQALNAASQLIGIANQLAGSNKNLQKGILIAESAIGIAKIVFNTNAANSAVIAKYALIPGGQALSAPEIIKNKVSAGIGIAATIAATAKALGALGGGGSAGSAPTLSGGSGGGAPSMPTSNGTPSIAAPQQNTTTFTGNNNNNFNQPPVKTYVVETDLRNSTNTIDKIKDQATF